MKWPGCYTLALTCHISLWPLCSCHLLCLCLCFY